MVTVAGSGRPISEIDCLMNLIEILTNGKYRNQAILPLSPQAIIERLYSLNYSSIEQAIGDSLERVKVNFYNILTLFARYGMQLTDDIKDCLESNIVNYVILDLLNCQEEVLKWSSAYYLAKCLKQEEFRSLPKPVSWKTNKRTFLGNLENLLIRFAHTGIDFCWSWNALKRGCAPLRFWNVVKSVRTHMSTLSQVKETPLNILQDIGRITKKIFKKNKNKNKLNSNFNVPAPSLSAGFDSQSSQPKGGNRQYIYNLLQEKVNDYQHEFGSKWTNGLSPSVSSLSIDVGKRLCMYDEESFWSEKGIDPDCLDPSSEGFTIEVEPDISGPQTVSNISDTSLFGLLESSVLQKTTAYAGVVALREPFKVRIITKSDSEINYYGIPLQKKLHTILKEIDTFQLIGRPLSLDIVQRHYGVIPEDHLVVSGDYSAATDNIHTDASLAALNSILELMDIVEDSKRVLRMTMQGQTLNYDNVFSSYVDSDPTFPKDLGELLSSKKKKSADYYDKVASIKAKYDIPNGWVVQKRGQLMGSILSFPILCLLNYIMFEIAFNEFRALYPEHADSQIDSVEPKTLTKKFGLLINGDDISFHASQLFIDVWSQSFPRIGLTESIGKNFVCRNKLTINSRMYVMEREGENRCCWTERKMFNGGLCFSSWDHVAKLDHRRKVDLVKSLPAIQKDFLRLPEGNSKDVFAAFDSMSFGFWNLEFLKTIPSVINWFVPTICGGLGLTTCEDVSWTQSQIRVATQALTRSSPTELRKFKILTDKSPLPEVTRKLLKVVGDISDNYLEPIVQVGGCDDEDELTTAFTAVDVFKNTLSKTTLETINNYTDKEYKKYIIGIKKRFNKLISYNSLSDISAATQKELNMGCKPLPVIKLMKDYAITRNEDTVNYAK